MLKCGQKFPRAKQRSGNLRVGSMLCTSFMLSVIYKTFILRVIFINVVMLRVVALFERVLTSTLKISNHGILNKMLLE
jgi:hypothetical protein